MRTDRHATAGEVVYWVNHRGRRWRVTLTWHSGGFLDDDGTYCGRWHWRIIDADPEAKVPLDGDRGFTRWRWQARRASRRAIRLPMTVSVDEAA